MVSRDNEIVLFSAYLQVGGVDSEITFRVPQNCILDRLEVSSDAADGTDYYIVNLRTGSTVIFSVTVQSGNTVVSDDTAPVSVSTQYNEGDTLNVQLDVNGTAANVLGTYIRVYARRAR